MADVPKRVLVVDDEAAIRRVLKICLNGAGHVVHEACTGREAVRYAAEIEPDIILLDLGLPDIGGAEVVRRVRQSSRCPILILSVRGQESEKVAVLDAGADDYLTKPFGTEELLARIRAILRRSATRAAADAFLHCGPIRIDGAHRLVEVSGHPVSLTPIEYDLLLALAGREGNVATHRQLVREVWGALYSEQALHVLHVTISKLRRKIEDDPLRPRRLVTEPGVGYRLRAGL